MVISIVISCITCLGIILVNFLKPSIKIKNLKINLYWFVSLCGAIILLISRALSINELWQGLTKTNGINPLQILILFISMSIISIFLDEVGFFAHLATHIVSKCKRGQVEIFITVYLLASVLTIFTSNDIVILVLTPFMLLFCKNGKINPIPFVVSEFIAANTWSMIFIIGNPTNIYLAQNAGIDFIEYFKVMALPTVGTGIAEFILLYLIFFKKLQEPLDATNVEIVKFNYPYTIVGLLVLLICTVLLVISSIINIPMYLISAAALCVLFVAILLMSLVAKQKPIELARSIKRAPLEIIPFILSIFVIILCLEKYEVSNQLSALFNNSNMIFTYGYSSIAVANLINNIPMSVLYSTILNNSHNIGAIYATIIGSNIGAFITPLGALAGIMWLEILKEHQIKYNILDFIKCQLPIGLVCATIAFSLLFITF